MKVYNDYKNPALPSSRSDKKLMSAHIDIEDYNNLLSILDYFNTNRPEKTKKVLPAYIIRTKVLEFIEEHKGLLE